MATEQGEGQFLRQSSGVDDLARLALDLRQHFALACPWSPVLVPAKHQATGRPLGLRLIKLSLQKRIHRLALGIEQWLPRPGAGLVVEILATQDAQGAVPNIA